MNALTIARLTVREASRRRLLLALLVLTLVIFATTGWGFSRLSTLSDRNGPLSVLQVRLITSQLLIIVMYMLSFVLALAAVFVAAPAISGELESGIALTVLARPLSRRDYVVGKWFGLAFLVVTYAVFATVGLLLTAGTAAGYTPPEPVQIMLYLALEGVVCLTLSLALSTRLSGMVGGVIALVTFGVAWLGGIVGGMGAVFANDAITEIGTVSRIVLPTDLLWRAAVWSLEPAATRALAAGAGPAASATPFFAAGPPEATWLLWALIWTVSALALAVRSLQSREI